MKLPVEDAGHGNGNGGVPGAAPAVDLEGSIYGGNGYYYNARPGRESRSSVTSMDGHKNADFVVRAPRCLPCKFYNNNARETNCHPNSVRFDLLPENHSRGESSCCDKLTRCGTRRVPPTPAAGPRRHSENVEIQSRHLGHDEHGPARWPQLCEAPLKHGKR